MEFSERKQKILAAIVDSYVQTGEPVGSKTLSEKLGFAVSSATIRNEMAELVEMGLLEQPHTSAGRVPSQRGYRVYIDRLMSRKPISQKEQQYIDGMLSTAGDDPEKLMNDVSQLLAGVTKMTAISTTPTAENASIRSIQLVQTGRRNAMVVLMASTGVIKNRIFRCDYDITPEILRIYYRVLNEKLTGLPLTTITPAFMQTLAASLGELSMLMFPVLLAVLESARGICEADIQLEGEANLLINPEFGPESVRRIMEFLNRRSELARFMQLSVPNGVHVMIGGETERSELTESSVLIARYSLDGTESGSIGVIGPMRMDYPKMIAHLEYFASAVGNLLSRLMETEDK